KRPDKKKRAVDRLLGGPRYVTHMARVWRGLMMPEAEQGQNARGLGPGFEDWLRVQFAANTPYDKIVRELLTVPVAGGGPRGLPLALQQQQGRANPAGWYSAKELLPENLATATAQLFLGVRLGCAQCHNHPFADWKREQFWSFAAFFSGVR